jgi:hypothetical protein
VVLEAPLDGGGGIVVMRMTLLGGGGGGGHTSDPVSGDPWPASLAPNLGSRVLVGLPLRPIRIHAVCLYTILGGDSSTNITLTGSLSSSSTAAATPSSPPVVATPSSPSSPPSLELSDDNTVCLSATR